MVLEMNVDIFTRSLTEITLDPARKNRLRVMIELHDQEFSSRKISDSGREMELPASTRT